MVTNAVEPAVEPATPSSDRRTASRVYPVRSWGSEPMTSISASSSLPCTRRSDSGSNTDKLTVLDTRDLATTGLSSDLRAMLAPALLATVLERLSAHLEVMRNHPLVTRRYYKRVAY